MMMDKKVSGSTCGWWHSSTSAGNVLTSVACVWPPYILSFTSTHGEPLRGGWCVSHVCLILDFGAGVGNAGQLHDGTPGSRRCTPRLQLLTCFCTYASDPDIVWLALPAHERPLKLKLALPRFLIHSNT